MTAYYILLKYFFQLSLVPEIIYTTDHALTTFSPETRGCYSSTEANLTYLPYSMGYRYELKNCIANEKIRDIIFNCHCYPRYFPPCIGCYFPKSILSCSGEKLACAIARENSKNITVPEALENPNRIENMTKPPELKCLGSCKIQTYPYTTSSVAYPQKENFFYQQEFCVAASHVWQVSCQNEHRKFFLDSMYPNICETLESFDDYFGKNEKSCQNWPNEFFLKNSGPNETLVNELYEYGKDNLALVHVLIQSPFVTKIKQDVAITFTNYVANTGGLLGLCLGFSFISAMEIFFWICCCCQRMKKKRPMGSVKSAVGQEEFRK